MDAKIKAAVDKIRKQRDLAIEKAWTEYTYCRSQLLRELGTDRESLHRVYAALAAGEHEDKVKGGL